MGYKVAVVGAGGLVGRTMIKVLEERNFPVAELFLFASERSAGNIIKFRNNEYKIQKLDGHSFDNIDIALFSAGKDVSVEFAPIAVEHKCIVVDNGSYWRMNKDVPLVVPEVNPDDVIKHNYIIANPNCSTIQLVVALKPLQEHFGIKRLVCSTYQSISGAGQKGMDKLMTETYKLDEVSPDVKHRIAFNTMFHEITDESGNSVEEIKMMNEIRKIMNLPELPIAVTCVRVPTIGGHGESLNIELNKSFEIDDIRDLFSKEEGVILLDNALTEEYPTPAIAKDTDPVYIGRIRRDNSVENGLYLWVVADNLRKGAATNAVQIAELLHKKNLIKSK